MGTWVDWRNVWGMECPQAPHTFRSIPGGAGPRVGEAVPVLSLLQDLSTRMTTLEERAGSIQGSSAPSPSMAPTIAVMPFEYSLVMDPALPSTSSAYLLQVPGMFGSLHLLKLQKFSWEYTHHRS